jgi:hypothetical protein
MFWNPNGKGGNYDFGWTLDHLRIKPIGDIFLGREG